MTEFDDVIRISTNYLDYVNLLDTFNKQEEKVEVMCRIVKEMKESDESNRAFAALLSSLALHETQAPKQKPKPEVVTTFSYRERKRC